MIKNKIIKNKIAHEIFGKFHDLAWFLDTQVGQKKIQEIFGTDKKSLPVKTAKNLEKIITTLIKERKKKQNLRKNLRHVKTEKTPSQKRRVKLFLSVGGWKKWTEKTDDPVFVFSDGTRVYYRYVRSWYPQTAYQRRHGVSSSYMANKHLSVERWSEKDLCVKILKEIPIKSSGQISKFLQEILPVKEKKILTKTLKNCGLLYTDRAWHKPEDPRYVESENGKIDGNCYHEKFTYEGMALALKNLKLREEEKLREKVNFNGVQVSLNDSLAAGNCRSGSEIFIRKFLSWAGYTWPEKPISADANLILQFRRDDYTLRACHQAAKR